MSNSFNKRLDEIQKRLVDNVEIMRHRVETRSIKPAEAFTHNERFKEEAKQAITSLIKELVAEAKPKTMPSNLSPENYERCERVVNQYHQNLLKALEEV